MLNTLEIDAPACKLKGCLADKAYGIIDIQTKKIHRISFSSSLLKYIISEQKNKNLQVREISFELGRELKNNEVSSTGIYAVCKSKTDWTLRISLIKEVANYICDFDTRKIRECFITKVW